MSTAYDEITARHYRAYRPELHADILRKFLNGKSFSFGLDIGCGTGQSAHALLNFCKKVAAIEPSRAMLENAFEHPNIEYSYYDTKNLNFQDGIFNIVSFAGSLFYAKSQKLLDDVLRVSRNGAYVVIYDFEVLLKDILLKLDFEIPKTESYNHEIDFSGLKLDGLTFIRKENQEMNFNITTKNLAHLLLSVKEQYTFFEKNLENSDTHTALVNELKKIVSEEDLPLGADIHLTQYQVDK